MGLLGSVELFLQIQSKMELHFINNTNYCLLSNDILKMISLDAINRTTDGLLFLEDYQSKYNSIMKTTIITNKRIHKQLVKIDETDNVDINLFLDTPLRRESKEQDSI